MFLETFTPGAMTIDPIVKRTPFSETIFASTFLASARQSLVQTRQRA
jgi:hypothetical protein